MKLINYILILILIYFVCCARTCTEEDSIVERNEKAALLELRDSIKQVFGIDFPDDKLLNAFEATAKQKLIDFSDYMKAASDSSLDVNFRKKATEMATQPFISTEIDCRNWKREGTNLDFFTLEQLLDEIILKGMAGYVQPIEINVKTPLTLENDSTYRGSLSFYQQYIPFNNPDLQEIITGERAIDIYIIKKAKIFGEEILIIWEAFLGDIY